MLSFSVRAAFSFMFFILLWFVNFVFVWIARIVIIASQYTVNHYVASSGICLSCVPKHIKASDTTARSKLYAMSEFRTERYRN